MDVQPLLVIRSRLRVASLPQSDDCQVIQAERGGLLRPLRPEQPKTLGEEWLRPFRVALCERDRAQVTQRMGQTARFVERAQVRQAPLQPVACSGEVSLFPR